MSQASSVYCQAAALLMYVSHVPSARLSHANWSPKNATSDAVEAQSLMEHGSVKLPDANTCEENLGTDTGLWAKWQCSIALDIADNPDSPLSRS